MMNFLSLFGVVWNETFADRPAGSRSPSFGDDDIREFKEAVYERLDKEHVMDTGSGLAADDGYHESGSAKGYYQSSEPTNNPASVALGADDAGRLYVDSATKAQYVWDGTAWVAISSGAATIVWAIDTAYSTGDVVSWGGCLFGALQDSTGRSPLGDVDDGTAQAGGSLTITLAAGASSESGFYNGYAVEIVSGTGEGQRRTISAYDGVTKVATITVAWDVNPSSDSVYHLVRQNKAYWSTLADLTVYVTGTDYAILDNDGYGFFIIYPSGAARNLTLPSLLDNIGRKITIVAGDINAGYAVTVTPEENENDDSIDGYGAAVAVTIDRAITLVGCSDAWHIENTVDGCFTQNIGRKDGLDIYYVGSQSLKIRVGATHINNGYRDYWVRKKTETAITNATDNWPTTGAWAYVLMDYLGNITLAAATGADTVRPSDNFFAWGELAGTGFDHLRQGYYSGNLKCIAAFHKVSNTSYYFINLLNGSDEIGENSNGRWTRKGNWQTADINVSQIGAGSSALEGSYGVGTSKDCPASFLSAATMKGYPYNVNTATTGTHTWAKYVIPVDASTVAIWVFSDNNSGYLHCGAYVEGPWHA